jgi:hypothetical protein
VATVIGNKFFRRGVTKILQAPTIATPTSPTVGASASTGELRYRGTTPPATLLADISAVNGFSYANQPIPTPDLDDNFDSSIVGVDAAENSSLEFYERNLPLGTSAGQQDFAADQSLTGAYRALLKKGDNFFICIFWGGFAVGANGPQAGAKLEVWPVQSAGPARLYDLSPTAAKWRAPFSPTARPSTDAIAA